MIGISDKREIPKVDNPINRYQRSFRLIPAKKYITANPAHVIVRSPALVSETLTVHQTNTATAVASIRSVSYTHLRAHET